MVKGADEERFSARSARETAESCAALALLAAGYVLQILGIVDRGTALVIAGAVLGVMAEVLVLSRERALARRLARAQCTAPVRQVVRDALLLGGLAGLGVSRPGGQGGWLLPAVLGCWALHFLCQAVAGAVRTRRRLPLVTRNIDASGLRPIAGPAGPVRTPGRAAADRVGALTTAGRWPPPVRGSTLWAEGGLCCGVALLAGTAYLASWLLPGKRVAGEEEALAWLEGWLAGYRPTVGMYFSGGNASAYQANMWLSTLAELDGRPVIVLRERYMVQQIEATDVPIVCIPKVAHLMTLEHSTLKVLLHPANAGKTSQALRIPSIKQAFINHGESDKLSSCNPYAKAYDEVWVAGPAARERYALADVGRGGQGRRRGRPPPAGPDRAVRRRVLRATRTTVLYAPTWEGWTDDPGNTSLILAGESIVAALLADPGVRLFYKPHPLTGDVDPRAGAGRTAGQRDDRASRRGAGTRTRGRPRGPGSARTPPPSSCCAAAPGSSTC